MQRLKGTQEAQRLLPDRSRSLSKRIELWRGQSASGKPCALTRTAGGWAVCPRGQLSSCTMAAGAAICHVPAGAAAPRGFQSAAQSRLGPVQQTARPPRCPRCGCSGTAAPAHSSGGDAAGVDHAPQWPVSRCRGESTRRANALTLVSLLLAPDACLHVRDWLNTGKSYFQDEALWRACTGPCSVSACKQRPDIS
eukprot:352902-Chlamydomonas_euryale.AAC.7